MLKEVYAPEMTAQVNDNVVALKLFGEGNSDEWQGSAVKHPIVLERGQSFMAHGALGVFPDTQNETSVQVSIPVKWIRGRILFSKEAMEVSRTSRGAWARANQFAMTRLVANLTDERNRMVNGTGTGILALVDGAGSGTTALTLDAPGGIAADGYGSRYIQPGMIIAITNGTTIYAVRQVSSITTETDSGATITLSSAVSAADAPDNAYIVRAANLGVTTGNLTRDTSYNNEPMGLDGIIDDGTLVATFQGVSRSTYPLWGATVISASAFSLSALQQLTDTINQVSGEPITDFLCHHSVRRAYLSAIDTTRQFVQASKGPGQFDLGLEPQGMTVSYNGMPMHVDKDARLGSLKAINRNRLDRYVLIAGEWAEDVHGILRWTSTDQDAFESIWRSAENLATDKCNAHGQLTGMTQVSAIRRHVA
jgi:hypothetical protein